MLLASGVLGVRVKGRELSFKYAPLENPEGPVVLDGGTSSKSKMLPIRDPHTVSGLFLFPPKTSLPWWAVTVRGHP